MVRRRLDDTTNATTTSSLERIDFSNAVATPSDLYGAYLGLMRSGLWLECRLRVELGVRGDTSVVLAIASEPETGGEEERNDADGETENESVRVRGEQRVNRR